MKYPGAKKSMRKARRVLDFLLRFYPTPSTPQFCQPHQTTLWLLIALAMQPAHVLQKALVKASASFPEQSEVHTPPLVQPEPKLDPNTTATSTTWSPLLDGLPTELRLMIWRRVLPHRRSRETSSKNSTSQETGKELTSGVKFVSKKDATSFQKGHLWVSGSVAIFRVNKQIYNEAMPILYTEETFTVFVQPRRALLEFLPVNRKRQPKFGLVGSNDGINVNNHPGLSLVRHWEVLTGYHNMKGDGKKELRIRGLRVFLNWLPQLLQSLCLVLSGRQRGQTIQLELAMVHAVIAHRFYLGDVKRPQAGRENETALETG